MNKNLLDYVELLANEKSVDKELVLMALESAIASAVKKSEFPGEDADIAVKVDPKTGDYQVWRHGSSFLMTRDFRSLIVRFFSGKPRRIILTRAK